MNGVAQVIRIRLPVQETQVRSLGWEDPLEKEMATHSRILAWEIPWTEEPGGLQSKGWQGVGHDLVTEHAHKKSEIKTAVTFTSVSCGGFMMAKNFLTLTF